METGPLSVTFSAGEVRELSWENVELVQRVFPTVRDAAWSTSSPRVESETTTRHDDGTLSYVAHLTYAVGDVPLTTEVRALVRPEPGTLDYRLRLEFAVAVDFNRIGIAVLHPLTQVRAAISWGGASGPAAEGPGSGELPWLVAPQHQVDGRATRFVGPYRQLEIALPEGTLRLEFDGDDFEMEDQRNWSDGSFKTYCTPLALGGPHHAEPGTVLEQRVRVTLTPPPHPHEAVRSRESGSSGIPGNVRHNDDATFRRTGQRTRLAAFATTRDPLSRPDCNALSTARALGFTSVVLDADDPASDAVADWAAAAADARLELIVRTPDPGGALDGVEVHHLPGGTTPELVELQLQDLEGRETVWMSVSPFVHSNDAWSLSRSPESFAAMMATLRGIAPDADLWLGPLRWDADEAARRFPPAVGSDRRQVPDEAARMGWLTRIMAEAGAAGLAGVAPIALGDVDVVRRHPGVVAALGEGGPQ